MRMFFIGCGLFGIASVLVLIGLVALMSGSGSLGIVSAMTLSWAVLAFGLGISYMVLYLKHE